MPSSVQSPAFARQGVTRIIAIHEVRGLDVAYTADKTALYCATPSGIVRLILPSALYIEKTRGERDCNGHPLPPAKIAREIRERQDALYRELEEDAARAREQLQHQLITVAPSAPSPLDDGDEPLCPLDRRRRVVNSEPAGEAVSLLPPSKGAGCRRKGEGAALCEQGWEKWKADTRQSLREVADVVRVHQNYLRDHFVRKHGVEYHALMAARNRPPEKSFAAVIGLTPVPMPEISIMSTPRTLSDLVALPSSKMAAEREAALRAAWAVFIAGPTLNYFDVGSRLGVTPSYLRRQFDRFAAEPGAPVLKPNGKL